MATSISMVDYKDIPNKTREMREEAKNLNREITNAYDSIRNMSQNWYGKRYNTLVTSFNKIIPSLNEMLKLVVSDIPDTLDTVASNYAKADGDVVSSSGHESPTNITEISTSNATGMRFMENEVSETKSSVERNFSNAISAMDTIETIYGRINWESDAASAFKNKFNSLKRNIIDSFDNINTQFNELIQTTISDMSATESANTVS